MNLARLPLAAARVGQEVLVCAVRGRDRQTQRLRELGILEGRTIRVLANSDSMICQIGDCRFGLCRSLARSVVVELRAVPRMARSA